MDMNKLDTKTPQDEGSFCHLAHTKYGHLMYTGDNADEHGRWIGADEPDDDQRVGLMVRGMESQTVQDWTQDQQRKQLARSRKAKRAEEEADRERENGLKFACILLVDFVNIFDGGEPLAATNENKRAFMALSDDLSVQLLAFAKDRDNFFMELSTR